MTADTDSKGRPAAERADEPKSTRPAEQPSAPAPVYVPPSRGRPRGRIGGGARGPNVRLPNLTALVPDHVALTERSQPELLWHLDALPPDRASLVFSLLAEDDIDPVVVTVLDRPKRAGIQRIDLAKHAVELQPEQEYQWSVALVTDFEHRSRDVITFGWIERVAAEPTSADSSARLASSGLWYDAAAAATPAELSTLLEQVGLENVEGP